MRKNTLMEVLNIHYYVKDGRMCASMPVNERSHQPMGRLHGGASAALAESVGSVASAMLIDLNEYHPVGTSIRADHIKGVLSGTVHATADLLHGGKRTHIWDIRITNEDSDMVASCRLSVMLIPAK